MNDNEKIEKRNEELEIEQRILMRSIPEDGKTWYTGISGILPIDKSVPYDKWRDERSQYVLTGDPARLDAMRAAVTFTCPPEFQEIQLQRTSYRREHLLDFWARHWLSVVASVIALAATVIMALYQYAGL